MNGILSEKTRIARKDYNCIICGRFIWEGSKYTRAYWKPEDYGHSDQPIDAKFCTKCHTPLTDMTTSPAGEDGYDYIRQYYGVTIEIGQRIMVNGITGTVSRPLDHQHYVHFIRDGAKHSEVAHPTWETVYYNEDGTIAADYRVKKPEEV